MQRAALAALQEVMLQKRGCRGKHLVQLLLKLCRVQMGPACPVRAVPVQRLGQLLGQLLSPLTPLLQARSRCWSWGVRLSVQSPR